MMEHAIERTFIGSTILLFALAAAGCPNGGGDGSEDTEIAGDLGDVETDGSEAGEAGPTCEDGETWQADVGACLCGGEECGEGTVCDPETSLCELSVDAECADADRWSAGTEAFREASADWGLPEIGADGVRLSVTDLEGDGWPDLVVREASNEPNRFDDEGPRRVWVLRNTGDGTFEDVTQSSGLFASRVSGTEQVSRPAQIAVFGDVDGDGDLDAYTGFDKTEPSGTVEESAEIMLNQGDGTFEFGPVDNAIRRPGEVDRPASATFVDYDRDGHLDLWVAQYVDPTRGLPMRDQLYRGGGDGTFERVTDEVGLDSQPWGSDVEVLNQARGHSLAWSGNACDLDGDGVPELLAGSYGRAPNHLWRGEATDAGVAYENVSVDSGYAFDERTDWTDNASARCYCELNPDAPDCEGVPAPERIGCEEGQQLRWNHSQDRELFRLGGNTGTTVCADIDTDGRLDLLANEIVHWDVGSSSDPSEILYNRTDDTLQFERPGREATGLTREHMLRAWNEGDITSGVFDFDNDGRPDIYIGSTDYPGTRGVLYHQTGDGTFESVPVEEGIDHTSSHGIALADFDRDGDLDLVAGHSRIRCSSGEHCYPEDEAHVRLFENRVGQRANWLQLRLVAGEGTNRAAIGARVEVETDAGTQLQEVGGGHGHYGIQHETTLHFGLGGACEARVRVRWPDAELSEQTYLLKPGHRYRWKQGEVPTVADIE